MTDKRVENLPLRDQLTEAERLIRELIDHVERGFLPKVSKLSRVASASSSAAQPTGTAQRDALTSVTDTTVRNQSNDVLKSDDFTEYVGKKADEHFSAIASNLSRIVEGE